MLYIIVNTGQKIGETKFSPTRPGGEIGEIFSWRKFLAIRCLYTPALTVDLRFLEPHLAIKSSDGSVVSCNAPK